MKKTIIACSGIVLAALLLTVGIFIGASITAKTGDTKATAQPTVPPTAQSKTDDTVHLAPTESPKPTEKPDIAIIQTEKPTESPTQMPDPTEEPTQMPDPTEAPTQMPDTTEAPSQKPTAAPTPKPTVSPTPQTTTTPTPTPDPGGDGNIGTVDWGEDDTETPEPTDDGWSEFYPI